MRMLEWITGARRGEVAKTLYSFLALFFLLLSYYLVKPLRNSQFLSSFDSNVLPLFYLIVPIISLAVTKLYNYFCDRIPKYRLMVLTFLILMGSKLIFWVYLPLGGRIAMVLFYFWASVYFLLAIALIWSCINTIFSSEQGERSFGFIAIGATLGNILGAYVSNWIALSSFKDQALVVASLAMGIAMGLLLLAIRAQQEPDSSLQEQNQANDKSIKSVPSRGWSDLRALWSNRYMRGIAVMVFTLALFNTLMDFQSQKIIDTTLSQKTYGKHFAWLNASEQEGQAFIQSYRQMAEKNQKPAVSVFLKQHQQAQEETHFAQAYKAYNSEKETGIRSLFSQIYFYQGILGTFLLLVISRFLFRKMGLRFSSLILPVFFLGVGVALFFPLDLVLLQVLMVVGGALNYSLNNANKELLYTVTSEDARFKLKPLVEGPVMRLGDVSASILKLALGLLLTGLLKSPAHHGDWLALGLTLAVVIFWIFAIAYTGGKYDAIKRRETHVKAN
jgi:ATP/ADP translocase